MRLQTLNALFKEKPNLRQEVRQLSEYGARPFEEVADAWYNLRSKSGSLTPSQQGGILKEALEFGRTDPGTSLDTLVDMFSLYAKKTGEQDPNRIQNVLAKTIAEAGGSTEDVSRYMPQFLPIGMAGGLSGPQAAGLWSYVTTQSADASIATTGLRASFMGLQGRGSPEGQKLLASLGVKGDMNFFQKMSMLSNAQAAGRFGLTDAEQIAGREGAAVLLDILNNPAAMLRTVGSVVAADTGDIDITGSMLEELLSSDIMAKTEEDYRRYQIGTVNQRASDQKAARWKRVIEAMEYYHRKGGDAGAISSWGVRKAAEARRLGGRFLGANLEDEERYIEKLSDRYGSPGGPTIINNYDNSIKYYPTVGTGNARPRFTQDE